MAAGNSRKPVRCCSPRAPAPTRDQHTLVAVERAVAAAAVPRVDFPYRLQGKRVPDKAAGGDRPPGRTGSGAGRRGRRRAGPAGAGRTVLRRADVLDGGRAGAAGGRADPAELSAASAGEAARTCGWSTFPDITVPVLMISGKSDPFGTPAEFDQHLAAIPAPVTQVWLTGGHDPRNADRAIGDGGRRLAGPRCDQRRPGRRQPPEMAPSVTKP